RRRPSRCPRRCPPVRPPERGRLTGPRRRARPGRYGSAPTPSAGGPYRAVAEAVTGAGHPYTQATTATAARPLATVPTQRRRRYGPTSTGARRHRGTASATAAADRPTPAAHSQVGTAHHTPIG